MAGRNCLPPNALKLREHPLPRTPLPERHALTEDPPVLHHRLSVSPPPSLPSSRRHPSSTLEERIAAQRREFQSLLVENQRHSATHTALKQELAAAALELRHLFGEAADIKAERGALAKEIYERSLKMEAEVRSIDALKAEVDEVRADVRKQRAARQELTAKLKEINREVLRARSELQQLHGVKAEIETLEQEIQRGRVAIECEKKVFASNLEHGQAMGKIMTSMAREIEKLHTEVANAEKRARAAAAAAAAMTPSSEYAAGYRKSELGHSGSSFHDPYAMHKVQGGVEAGPQHGSSMAPHSPYNVQTACS